jgi:hypothetical protein
MSSDAQTTRDDAVEAAMLARIEAGEMFEDIDELSPRYREILRQTAEIASISEVSVLTWACTAYPTHGLSDRARHRRQGRCLRHDPRRGRPRLSPGHPRRAVWRRRAFARIQR